MSDTSQKSVTCTNSLSTSIQMQGLLGEFKLLYQNKLKKFELQEPLNEETLKLKVKTLESYVKDLLEQNDVLVQTIDELEKEANNRVAKLETKLIKASNSLKVYLRSHPIIGIRNQICRYYNKRLFQNVC